MRFRLTVLSVAAGLMAYQLFCDPIVGYPNNGDFGRVLGIYHLQPVCEGFPNCYFKFVVPRYRFDPAGEVFFDQVSTEQLTILPAVLLNTVLSKDGFLNIRMIGLVHSSLWILGFWLLMPLLELTSGWRRNVLAALLIVVYCDVVYVQYSNSFYMDTSAVIFLFLSLILLMRLAAGAGSIRTNAAGLMAAIFLGAMSKTQHALLFVVLLGVLIIFRNRYWPFPLARLYTGSAVILAGVVLLFATVPPSYKQTTFYSVVFDGILPRSADPAQTLRDLGLPEAYVKYSGTHGYSAKGGMFDAAFMKDFTPRVSTWRLLAYEVLHPRVLALLVYRGLADASIQRYPGYGTLPRSDIHPDRVYSHAWSLWSATKRLIFEKRATAMFSYLLLSSVALCAGVMRHWPQRRDILCAALAVCLAAVTALSIATLLDVVDTLRHLHVYVFLVDTIAIAAFAAWIGPARAKAPPVRI